MVLRMGHCVISLSFVLLLQCFIFGNVTQRKWLCDVLLLVLFVVGDCGFAVLFHVDLNRRYFTYK